MKKKDQIRQLTEERDRARDLACEYEAEIAWMRGFGVPRRREVDLNDRPFDLEQWMRIAQRVMEEPE